MADTSQGDGWWQASDLKWYPPESHPDYRPPPPPKRPIDYIADMPDSDQPAMVRGRDEYVLAGVAAVIVVAAFMPWATVLFFSVDGIQGDGQITALAGAAGVAAAMFGRNPKAVGISTLIAGIVATGVGGYDLANLEAFSDDSGGTVEAGVGLWLTVMAGCVLVGMAGKYLSDNRDG